MHMADIPLRRRIVRCPKCRTLLLEPDTEIYECPECCTCLEAKRTAQNSEKKLLQGSLTESNGLQNNQLKVSSSIGSEPEGQDQSNSGESQEHIAVEISTRQQEYVLGPGTSEKTSILENNRAEDPQLQSYSVISVAALSTTDSECKDIAASVEESMVMSRESSLDCAIKKVVSNDKAGNLADAARVSRAHVTWQDSVTKGDDKAVLQFPSKGEMSISVANISDIDPESKDIAASVEAVLQFPSKGEMSISVASISDIDPESKDKAASVEESMVMSKENSLDCAIKKVVSNDKAGNSADAARVSRVHVMRQDSVTKGDDKAVLQFPSKGEMSISVANISDIEPESKDIAASVEESMVMSKTFSLDCAIIEVVPNDKADNLGDAAQVSRAHVTQQDSVTKGDNKAVLQLPSEGEMPCDMYAGESVSGQTKENYVTSTSAIDYDKPRALTKENMFAGKDGAVEGTHQEEDLLNDKKDENFQSEIVRDNDCELSFKYIDSNLKSNEQLAKKKRNHRLAKSSSESCSSFSESPSDDGSHSDFDFPPPSVESAHSSKLSDRFFEHEKPSPSSSRVGPHQLEWQDAYHNHEVATSQNLNDSTISSVGVSGKIAFGALVRGEQEIAEERVHGLDDVTEAARYSSCVQGENGLSRYEVQANTETLATSMVSGIQTDNKEGSVMDFFSRKLCSGVLSSGPEQILQLKQISILTGDMQSAAINSSTNSPSGLRQLKTCSTIQEDGKLIISANGVPMVDAGTSSPHNNVGDQRIGPPAAGAIVVTGGNVMNAHSSQVEELESAGMESTLTFEGGNLSHYGAINVLESGQPNPWDYCCKELQVRNREEFAKIINANPQYEIKYSSNEAHGLNWKGAVSDSNTHEAQGKIHNKDIYLSRSATPEAHVHAALMSEGSSLQPKNLQADLYSTEQTFHTMDAHSIFPTRSQSLKPNNYFDVSGSIANTACSYQVPSHPLMLPMAMPGHACGHCGCPVGRFCMPYVHCQQSHVPKIPAPSCLLCLRKMGYHQGHSEFRNHPQSHQMGYHQGHSEFRNHPQSHQMGYQGHHPQSHQMGYHQGHSEFRNHPESHQMGYHQGHSEFGNHPQSHQIQASCMACHSPTCFSPQIANMHDTSVDAAKPPMSSVRKPSLQPPLPQGRSAPYVLCKGCYDFLEVPAHLPPNNGEIQKLRCNACGKVSKFSLVKSIEKSPKVGLKASSVEPTLKASTSSPFSFEFMVQNREVSVTNVGQNSESLYGEKLHSQYERGSLSSHHHLDSGVAHHSLQGEMTFKIKPSHDEADNTVPTANGSHSSQDEFFFRSLSRKSEFDSSRSLFRGFKTMPSRFGISNIYDNELMGSGNVSLQCSVTVDEKEEGLDFGAPRPSDGESLDQRSPESRMRSPENFRSVEQARLRRHSFGDEEAWAIKDEEQFGSKFDNSAQGKRPSNTLIALLHQESTKFGINLEGVCCGESGSALSSPASKSPTDEHRNAKFSARKEKGRLRDLTAQQFVRKGPQYIASMLRRSLRNRGQ